MKLGDGMFIDTTREIAKNYPSLNYEEIEIDTICMKLA